MLLANVDQEWGISIMERGDEEFSTGWRRNVEILPIGRFIISGFVYLLSKSSFALTKKKRKQKKVRYPDSLSRFVT